MSRPGVAVLALAAATCGGPQAPARIAPRDVTIARTTGGDSAPGDTSGGAVSPRAYRLELAIDPSASGYTGTIDIDLSIAERTSAIWLDATDLRIGTARLTSGGQVTELTQLADAPEGKLGLSLPAPIDPTDDARLEISFAADYRTDDGIFAQTYRATSYVYSDFEPIDARRAFPCFDDPRWKTPWTISLVVPAGMVALSNARQSATTDLGGDLARVDFATSPALPTYLVAIAVGPFELVEASDVPVPVRIAVPSGRTRAAEHAAAFAPELLGAARDFLERDVPVDKLDVIAIPRFGGAMENPGLVTVASDILLDGHGERDDRRLALVLAHEIAHLWFGDWVTLADWRDLWINEGFASWMADEMLARWRPGWSTRRDEVTARFEAMHEDELPGALPLRPDALDGPRSLFNLLTYQKAASILHMVEDWVGPDRFVAALRGYLDGHAGGSAITDDVLGALASLGDEVRPVVESLLAAPGVPAIDAELSCGKAARLHLSLRADPAAIHVPACVRWNDGHAVHRACAVVTGVADLDLGARCPTWVHPNADGSGYYRWTLTGAALADTIDGDGTSERERLDAALGAREALAAGTSLESLAAALDAGARSAIPPVVEAAVADYRLLLEQLAPPRARKAIAAHLRGALAPSLKRLGTAPRRGDTADDLRLRVIVLGAAGDLAHDTKVLAWARKIARRWLRDRRVPADPDLLEPALLVAAAHADGKVAAALFSAAENALDAVDVDASLIARALGRLPRARALRALGDALDGALPSVTTFAVAVELLGRRDTARAAADALASHGDWLAIALTFAPTCDPSLIDRIGEQDGGADPSFAQALERRRRDADRCAALRPRVRDAARAFR